VCVNACGVKMHGTMNIKTWYLFEAGTSVAIALKRYKNHLSHVR